ncbi:Uncharacterised protein [uncultured Eubacterium sp.]|uniref:DUF4190 domain-containing protein n=1 Tax=Brotomerdimonas butyrica TaxID=2981721 RepID=UPI00082190CE|nr:DUF4190 domain-containing protein [Brotomerdimonas butyrica]SCH62797.1 Uncharacterised protein [uncultured Eubacterium sp.]
MDNNMNNSNDMNNSINNMNNNVMPDKSTAEGEGLYTEAVQMHSESEAARQGFVQPQEAAAEAAAPAEAAWNDTPAGVAGTDGTAGIGQTPQQMNEVPYTGTGRQIYQVGDQWQIGSPQTGQQYTQGDAQQGSPQTGQQYTQGDAQQGSLQTGQQYTQGDAQQGVYGTGADQWQTVKEQQPYGASQYDQNNGNGAWQQNSTAQYQNQSSGQWQQNAGQYQTQHNEHPNYTYDQNSTGGQYQQYTTQQAPAHGKAVASLILGIVGTVCCAIGVCGVVGLILAIMAKKEGNNEGIRTVGFILSIIATVLWGVFMIMMIAGIASDPYYYLY